MQAEERTRRVIGHAKALGFNLCGVVRASAEALPELSNLEEWLARGHAGEMGYLSDARRRNPANVLPGARSLIVCAANYNTSLPYSTDVRADSNEPPRGWISRYGWGDDYHEVLGAKLKSLVEALHEEFSEPFEARAYVDTGPVVERIAAKHAGLGWLAKNTCLIHESLGSWLFLSVIATTLDLAPSLGATDLPPADQCGNCRLCLDACPTGALVEPYLLDSRRCISYLTIELHGDIPEDLRAPMGWHVFGCDICQDVCPWNRKAPVTHSTEFLPRAIGANQTSGEEEMTFYPELEWLAALSPEQFRKVFRGSAVRRSKWQGLARNACIALGNSGVHPGSDIHARIAALLRRLAESEDKIVASHARWALERLSDPIRTV